MQTVAVTKSKAACQIKNTHPSKLSNGNIVLYDKAHPHVAQRVQDLVNTYNLILSPRDCHIFGPLNKALTSCMFMSDGDIQKLWYSILDSSPRNSFTQDITDLCINGTLVQMPVVISVLLQHHPLASPNAFLLYLPHNNHIGSDLIDEQGTHNYSLTYSVTKKRLCKQCMKLFAM
jgi:hypothetical protein